jgi:hypothetical protein
MWTVAAASVKGRGHEQTGLPCQDSSAVEVSPNGRWVALVASDGAGTAKFAEIGSQLVVRAFVKRLVDLSTELDRLAPGAWVSDALIGYLIEIRHQLRDLAGSDDISNYHCTLTAALIGPNGGVTVHVGDGAIFGGTASAQNTAVLDLDQGFFVSTPQNGEYANETVFLTERDWVKQLRIKPLGSVDWIMLGTDGGMALAMVGEAMPKSGFVTPVIRTLIEHEGEYARSHALSAILNDHQADRLTNDDKTLVVAIKSYYRDVVGDFVSARAPDAETNQPDTSKYSIGLLTSPAPVVKVGSRGVAAKTDVDRGLHAQSAKSGVRRVHAFSAFAILVTLTVLIALPLWRSPSTFVAAQTKLSPKALPTPTEGVAPTDGLPTPPAPHSSSTSTGTSQPATQAPAPSQASLPAASSPALR